MILRTDRRTTLIAQVVLTIVAIIFLAPMLVIMSTALRGPGLGNFVTVLQDPVVPRFLFNSVVVAGGTVVLVLVTSTLAAFAFVVLPLRGNRILLLTITAAIMIPPAAIIFPLFLNVRALGLLNSPLAVIGPVAALTIPVMIIMTRSYLAGISSELIDAARVDGCGRLQALVLVLLPLMRPILVVVTVWTFLAAWNEYFMPLIFLRKLESQVITQAPAHYTIDELQVDLGVQFAALILISLPTLALFLRFRRHLLESVTTGGVK